MQERHRDRKRYFDEQATTTREFVIPYLEQVIDLSQVTKVLEIGCGEGGNMLPFLERGYEVVGVDLNEKQLGNAKAYLEASGYSKFELFYKDIYDVKDELGHFNIIIMRDVIEHIHDQEKFMNYVKRFLAPSGVIFFGFPPWQMPFGGHQQAINHKLLSKLPYYHLLPTTVYKGIMRLGNLPSRVVESRLEIKQTGISIERFEKCVSGAKLKVKKRTHYLINPNYKIKFGLTPKKQFGLISLVPYFRNYLTTCAYYVIGY